MPASYAHLIFGRRVFGSLSDGSVKAAIECGMDLFEIGLLGPDILFFYQPLTNSRLSQIGHNMHEKSPMAFLERPICRSASDCALSYLLGFICHYALDSECHTSVEYHMEKSGRMHSEIETDFERVLMLGDGVDPYRTSPVSCIVNTRENSAVIARIFDTQPGKIHAALTTMKLVSKTLISSSDSKYSMLKRIGRWMGEGSAVAQLTMDRAPDPIYIPSNQELSQKLEQSVPVAVALMENFLDWQRNAAVLSQRLKPTFSYDPLELARRKERENRV